MINLKITFQIRACFYAIVFIAVGWLLLKTALNETQIRYDAGDMSAFAWTGFWPFIFPLFWAQSAIYVFPFAAALELSLWIGRAFRGRRR